MKKYGFPETVGNTTMTSFNDRSASTANSAQFFLIKLNCRDEHTNCLSYFHSRCEYLWNHHVNANVKLEISIPTWCARELILVKLY